MLWTGRSNEHNWRFVTTSDAVHKVYYIIIKKYNHGGYTVFKKFGYFYRKKKGGDIGAKLPPKHFLNVVLRLLNI